MYFPCSQKKNLPAYLPAVLILTGALLTAGCTSQPASGTANPAGQTPAVKIADILKNPAAYNGTAVAVQGKINAECGSGCWFMMDDGTGTLYVDLAPNNFAIPQISGTTVVVHGTISVIKGDPTLVATKVVTDSRTYP
ncbi:MAG: hypothetical protein WCB46_01995 [Methanoregula sp.]